MSANPIGVDYEDMQSGFQSPRAAGIADWLFRKEKAFYEALGRRIEQLRTAKNWSQNRLGEALTPPLTRAAISNIETAKQRVLAHVLVELARVLSVSVADLVVPVQAALPIEVSNLKRTLEDALPEEAVAMFTRRIDRQQRLAAKKGKTT